MASLVEQIAAVEAGLARMSQRVADFPATQILVSRLLVYLGREVTGQLDQRLRPYNLNEIEFRALMVLYSTVNSTANPGELCIGLNQSSANITRITDVLVARGLITRVPDGEDRRRLVLQITPHGTTLLNEILPVLLTVMRTTYRDFPVEELNQVVTSLKGFAAALDRMSQSAKIPSQLASTAPGELLPGVLDLRNSTSGGS